MVVNNLQAASCWAMHAWHGMLNHKSKLPGHNLKPQSTGRHHLHCRHPMSVGQTMLRTKSRPWWHLRVLANNC
jgi:hypothetical protein